MYVKRIELAIASYDDAISAANRFRQAYMDMARTPAGLSFEWTSPTGGSACQSSFAPGDRRGATSRLRTFARRAGTNSNPGACSEGKRLCYRHSKERNAARWIFALIIMVSRASCAGMRSRERNDRRCSGQSALLAPTSGHACQCSAAQGVNVLRCRPRRLYQRHEHAQVRSLTRASRTAAYRELADPVEKRCLTAPVAASAMRFEGGEIAD